MQISIKEYYIFLSFIRVVVDGVHHIMFSFFLNKTTLTLILFLAYQPSIYLVDTYLLKPKCVTYFINS